MAISQKRYVDIASAVIGAGGVAMQKLVGRVFTDHPKLPVQSILAFASAAEVRAYFGQGQESDFAVKYFSVTTPAPVSKAKELQFATHLLAPRSPSLTSTQNDTLEDIKIISGTALIVAVTDADGSETLVTVSPDVSGASSLADAAGIIETALQLVDAKLSLAFTGGTFKLGYTDAGFMLAVNNTVLGQSLGLDGSAIRDAGGSTQTMDEAYLASLQRSNSYGSAYFINRGVLSECVAAAQLNASENVRHMLFLQVTAADRVDFSEALIDTASVGLILKTPGEFHLASLPMALQAATDYTRKNATMNYMFRQAGVTTESQVTDTLTANMMDASRINYYGMTAEAGSEIKFFQRGFLCGNPTAPLDMSVHSGEQWLKAHIGRMWFDMLLSTRGIAANLDGKARGAQVVTQAIEDGINNGVILRGKEFSVIQRLAISDATGDELGWAKVQNDGAWFSINIVEQTGPSNLTEYVMNYVLVYGKGDWVRKVEGSHNLT